MEPSDFDAIFVALQVAHVRYLVVGGVAVVLHGSPRFTADLDLVIALDGANIRAAISALGALGYTSRAPVPVEQLAEPAMRRLWIEEKHLVVFSLWSPAHPATEIDIFVEEPFPFDEAYARGTRADLGTSSVTVASIPDLIALKRQAGRPKDLLDIEALEAIAKETSDGD
ncbi:MAG: nucleotidyl transferase AbiEii/AbiGii toxin family protein [Kofleriaceae bacterium]